MNKKSVIIVAVIAIAIGTVAGSKAMLGDSKIKLPGEEGTENVLHVQESTSAVQVQSNNTAKVQAPSSTESTESGP